MYDSFLYGYGLTLAIFDILIKMTVERNETVNYYFNFNDFLKAFLHAEDHKRIIRRFNKYFELNRKTQKAHDDTKAFLIANENEIYSLGFERWISKHIFNKDNPQISNMIVYTYILYNYWYHLLYSQILQQPYSLDFITKAGMHIERIFGSKKQIYTTNFDTILDKSLSPKHIHGTFALPLEKMQDLILDLDREKNEFEYTYLLGTNGFEKLNRLNLIGTLNQSYYDLDLFFQDNLKLGNLMIYGMSFGYNQIMPIDYLEANPEHKNFTLLRSVDGHILSRINALYLKNRINKITISYFSDDDLEGLENIIGTTDFHTIVKYIQSNELFDFNTVTR